MTLIDKYMMFSFTYITAIVVEVTIYDSMGLTLEDEVPIMIVNILVCVAFHIALMFYCYKLRMKELGKIEKNRRQVDADYEGAIQGASKDQFIAHTGVTKASKTGQFTVYEGRLRDETLGWMMPK